MSSDLTLRIETQTFADESFKSTDPSGLVVLADLPGWAELRWHGALVRHCGPNPKWNKVASQWSNLGLDLRRSLLRDVRDSLISIVDPSIYRVELDRQIALSIPEPRKSWSPAFLEFVERMLATHERQSILWDSPLAKIQDFLEDDGLSLWGFGGIQGNADDSRSLISEFEMTLKAPHTLRLFGARSASAFSVLFDRDQLARALDELWEIRYVTPQRVMAHLLAVGERTERIFDQGNQPSAMAIQDLKGLVRKRLVGSGLIVLPDDVATGVREESSRSTPMLQAADLAAGYARKLYLRNGLRVVCEEFKAVILNGSMVRDWAQIETSSADLRLKK